MLRALSFNRTTCRLGYKAFSTSRIYRQPRHLNLASEAPNKQPRSTFPSVRYVGPVLVGAAISTTSFITAAYIFDRNQQSLWEPLLARSREWSLLGATEESLLAELWREKRIMMMEKQKALLEKLANTLDSMSLPIDVKRAVWMVGEKLSSMTESEKTLAGLIALNTLVFGCWQVPRLAPFMNKWFLHLPGSTRNITLLTSCFSHQEFFHFALNMVGLWSFGRIAHEHLGREQFVAMYLSVGVGANVVSHVCSLALRHSRPLLPSLGASGAIYGLLASTAVLYPHSSISLIFLPMFPIKLGHALPALMGFDFAGIMLKWRMFDHFAHLAGASFGLIYTYYGAQGIWTPLVRKIHDIRHNGRGNNGGEGGTYMWLEPRQPPVQTNKWSGWFNK